MYKFLLCWRYLRTRWIALASIVSVTLGVATMIVVNGVMGGFATEMRGRIRGILSDVSIDSINLDGFPEDSDALMEQIREVAGDEIEAMTPTVHVPGMLTIQFHGQQIHRPVTVIGIDARSQSLACDFGKYLQHPENRERMSFDLREEGYDAVDHQAGEDARFRSEMEDAGWVHRRRWAAIEQSWRNRRREREESQAPRSESPATEDASEDSRDSASELAIAPSDESLVAENSNGGLERDSGTDEESSSAPDPFANDRERIPTFDPLTEQHSGAVLGIGIAMVPGADRNDRFFALPGSDVTLTFPTVSSPPRAKDSVFTIVDFYESKMSEYDANFVFVPIEELQRLRGMYDPVTGVAMASSIQIKLKEGVDGSLTRDRLRAVFPPQFFSISTWQDKQSTLLDAVRMETAILNVLLFFIIAVAGFGILAIFFMIVVEKTRDIGILKSLGASRRGILGIFLGYGLSLGTVGAGAGLVMGLLVVANINDLADLLGKLTGTSVYDPNVYFFFRIPTIVEPLTVAWITLGAMAIAVLASVAPARRAAGLHPVEALRYE